VELIITELDIDVCLLHIGPAVSDRDVALFEEVLWQPTAEEAEHELDEHDVGNTDAHKEEGSFEVAVLWSKA